MSKTKVPHPAGQIIGFIEWALDRSRVVLAIAIVLIVGWWICK